MKVLINYANGAYKKSQRWNTWTAKYIGGFDRVYSFSENDIDNEFSRRNDKILSYKRGNGLWIWKPYFINKVLNECNDGDLVFYSDSGALFIRKIDSILVSMKCDENIWVSDNPLLEKCFTKEECLKKMNCDDNIYKETNQIQATYLMVRCNDISKQFVKEWLELCEDETLISPEDGTLINGRYVNDFVSHREDQSILSLLCKKKGIIPHKDPSHRGNYPETFYNRCYDYRVPVHLDDKYKPVIFLHKYPDISLKKCFDVMVFALKRKLIVKYYYKQ